jgi:hypothetical protein
MRSVLSRTLQYAAPERKAVRLNDCPWQNYVLTGGGDPRTDRKWICTVWWGTEDMITTHFDKRGEVPTNKKVGVVAAA